MEEGSLDNLALRGCLNSSSISKPQYHLEWCLKFSILPPTYDPSFYSEHISMESLPLPSQFQALSFPPPTSTLATQKRQSKKAGNSFQACALHLCWCPATSRAEKVEKTIFTLYTESDNDILSDWLSSQEAWALTHSWKKAVLNAAFCSGAVFPPFYIDRNISKSICPYGSQCLPLSAEMEVPRQLITIYLFIPEALCASTCLSFQAKEMHELPGICALQRTASLRIHPKMLQINTGCRTHGRNNPRHHLSIRKQLE